MKQVFQTLWNQHNLKISELREKIILLKEEFDGKNRLGNKNYSKRLDAYLKRRVGKQSKELLYEAFKLSLVGLVTG